MRTTAVVFAALAAIGLVSAAGAVGAEEPDLERGAELYELCQQCHGENGEGNPLSLAPAIAGFDQWYVELQLNNYREGIRGLHPEDIAGMRMYPMSKSIKEDEDVTHLAAYVASLPPARPPVTLDGDAQKGQALYATCAACHGPEAQGMEVVGGPNLRVTSDWYLVKQLHKYKTGVRGRNPGDVAGARMWPISLTLADEQAMKDVVAYIMTLRE